MPTFRLFVTLESGEVLTYDVTSWRVHESGEWLVYTTPQNECIVRATYDVESIRAIAIDGAAAKV